MLCGAMINKAASLTWLKARRAYPGKERCFYKMYQD